MLAGLCKEQTSQNHKKQQQFFYATYVLDIFVISYGKQTNNIFVHRHRLTINNAQGYSNL